MNILYVVIDPVYLWIRIYVYYNWECNINEGNKTIIIASMFLGNFIL